MAQDPDFHYHVSDNLPPIGITLVRNGSPVDLTNIQSNQVTIRQSGGSTNVIVGTASVVQATAGQILFYISGAGTGSAGFPTPGYYLGQFFASFSNGRMTSSEFVILVKPSYRLL